MPPNAVLLAVGNLVGSYPDPVRKQPRKDSARLLMLDRRGSHLLAAIHPGMCLTMRPNRMDQLLKQMTKWRVGVVAQLPVEQIVTEWVSRERVFLSSIRHGVAMAQGEM